MNTETSFVFQNSIKRFGCIPPALGNYGLTTCKNGSEYSMREVHNSIDCPKPCTKYSMQLRSEYKIRVATSGMEQDMGGPAIEGPMGGPMAGMSNDTNSDMGNIPNDTVTYNRSVQIFLNELIEVSYDQYSYIWLNLVAEVGGYVGLFLGFSVFQVTDLMDVLLQRNWIESFKSLLNRFKPRVATGTPTPQNPTRETHYSTRPEHEFTGSGKTRPDQKPKEVKPIATLFKTSKD